MREITQRDYEKYVREHEEIVFRDRIGKREVVIKIGEDRRIKRYGPKSFELEGTTVWSYPRRGSWATHRGDYRGNWPPQMARNIILRYSRPGESVLDQMVGSGTTLIECKLLGRNGVGVDVNPECVYLTRDRLNFTFRSIDPALPETVQRTYVGDARSLNEMEDASIDLIATHPPYASIIPYSKERLPGDLSYVHSVDGYVLEMKRVAEESLRVLKPGRYCAILVGDTRRNKHYVPIAFRVMQTFLDAGLILKEDVIKHQWRCKATPFWLKRSLELNFLLIMHEHLFVFRKPSEGERMEKYKESIKWW